MSATGRGPATLQLLGSPRLGKVPLKSVRAALLAYLALEGQTPRPRLAQLLWPGAPSRQAHNNLAAHLHRLRRVHPEECIVGEDQLALAEGLAVDVRRLQIACEQEDYGAATGYTGELLAGLQFDEEDPEDGQELRREEPHRWLQNERLRVRDLQRRAHLKQIERLEKERMLPDALELARRLCLLDDTGEDGWLAVMRLHFAMGERAAALAAHDECRSVLRRRVSAEPSAEMKKR